MSKSSNSIFQFLVSRHDRDRKLPSFRMIHDPEDHDACYVETIVEGQVVEKTSVMVLRSDNAFARLEKVKAAE